jgi:hypothetical protein
VHRSCSFANARLQLQKYLQLPQKGKCIAEYVWIDGSNGLRSKCKVRAIPNPQSPVVPLRGVCPRVVIPVVRFAAG